ncbi:MAG TPA: hypothetical protein VJM08_03710 [Anaerolineales bacterium]|nr:hypothetical protein [Anaerolineales bacterium]
MSGMIFEDNPSSRKAIRFLLLVQITAVGIVLALILFQFYSLALSLSCITLLMFAAIALWLYVHYLKFPIVREKRHLQKRALDLQHKLAAQTNIIRAATRKRTALFQDQQDEINVVVQNSGQAYVKHGLENSFIKDAQIPGVGPKLRERLAEHRITNAAQIKGEKLSKIPGFGESKRQALFSWRNTLRAELESTKPTKLTDEQAETIKRKYHALHHDNDIAERDAQARKRDCSNELNTIRPRLEQLASITFIAYVSQSLDSRKAVGILLALLLICAQVVSSVSATASSFIVSIPTATTTPSQTATSTATLRPTNTFTQTITSTSTITDTPTLTFTPLATSTPLPTFTPLVILQPSNTPQIPVSGGGSGDSNCHPSYPGVCIPYPPPDLDCPDIPYRNFQVLPPDPHNFDREGDGLGCEN